MAKNLVSGAILASSTQIWATKIFLVNFISTRDAKHHFVKLSFYEISNKAYEPNLRKWQKT